MHYLVWRTEPKRFFLFFRVTYHTGRDQRLPPFIFFGTARLFFRKKKFSPKGPPCIFLMFCDRMDVEKAQRVPPFSFFSALWDFFTKMTIFVFFNFFVLRQNGCWKTSKGPPFSFSALWDFSAPFFWVCNFLEKFFFKKFRFSSTVKEYLTLGSLFAIFEPWIWRRLGPVPACLC